MAKKLFFSISLLKKIAKDDNKSLKEYAKELGCDKTTLHRKLREHNLKKAKKISSNIPVELKDRKWLETKYLEEGRTAREIAQLLGISPYSVYTALHDRFNIRKKPRKEYIYRNEEWLRKKVIEERMTDEEIALLAGTSKWTIRYYRQKFGLMFEKIKNLHQDLNWLMEQINQGLSIKEIAERSRTTRDKIFSSLKNLGIYQKILKEFIFFLKEKVESTNILNEREIYILKLKYGLEDGIFWSLDEIGNKLDISRERVNQIRVLALEKLKLEDSKKGNLNWKRFNFLIDIPHYYTIIIMNQ